MGAMVGLKLLLIFLIVHALLMVVGCATGYVVHLVMPAVELGTTVAIGVAATYGSVYTFNRALLNIIGVGVMSEVNGSDGATADDDLPPRGSSSRTKR